MINIEFYRDMVNDKFANMFKDYTTPIYLLIGGAGSGKSYVGVQKILIKACITKRTILIVRKVGTTIKDSIWKLTLELLSRLKLKNKCIINKTDKYIILPNGSELMFKSLDDPEKIKSIAMIDDIVIEEATELNFDDYNQLKLRLRSQKSDKQIHLFCNPVSKANWIYDLFFVKGEMGAKVIHSTYLDNKFLPQDYIDQLQDLQRTNINFYKIYTLGEFATLDKLILTNYKIENFDIKEISKSTNGEFIVGIDFGYLDDNAIVGAFFDIDNKKIYVDNEFVGNELSNREIYSKIEKLHYQKELIIGDSAEPKTIAELKRLGAYRIKESPKGADSVLHGIRFLQTYEIIIHPRCIKFAECIENYTWKKDKKTGEYIEEPNHDEASHICDALRYASTQIWKDRKLKTLDRKILGV